MAELALLALAALGGWAAGLGSAATSGRLAAADERARLPDRGPLLVDPLVQAGLALTWAALLLALGPTWRWLGAAILAVPLVQVGVTDLRSRWVDTPVAGGGLLAGLALSPLVRSTEWWSGLAGALGGGVVFALLYGLGRRLYRGEEPLARGDILIAAMVGATAGPQTAAALVAGALLSGALAAAVLVARRSARAFIPYGPGLCLGGLLALFLR